MIWGLFKVFFW